MMKKIIVTFFAALVIFSSVFPQAVSAEVLQKLSGIVIGVDLVAQELSVQFEHPVTGESVLKIFDVHPETGFKNAKRKLRDVKVNDPVSIDYKENENRRLNAVYIEVISLDGLPFDTSKIKKPIPA